MQVHIFQNDMFFMRDQPGAVTHDLPDTSHIATTVAYVESVIQAKREMPSWIDWLANQVFQAHHEINPASS